MVNIGTPLTNSSTKLMLLGSGELGKEVAMELEAGKEIEIKDPPKHLIDGGYLLEAKKGDK